MKKLSCSFFTFLLFALLTPLSGVAHSKEFSFYHENVLGTSLELHLSAPSEEIASAAESKILAEIDRLSNIYSHYSSSSEFARFLQLPIDAQTKVSPELAHLLKRCEQWTHFSQGAFNPAAEAISRRWQHAAESSTLPTAEEIQNLVSAVNQPHWRIDIQNLAVTRVSQQPLSLNAIAKGTILDALGSLLENPDLAIDAATINIGGDIRVVGAKEVQVNIPHPLRDRLGSSPIQQVVLKNQSIATSGASERSYVIGQQSYSHIVDPRTGRPSSVTLSASVIATDAETADVLATIASVLPPAEAIALVESIPAAHCFIVAKSGEMLCSSNWPDEISIAQETAKEVPATDEKTATPKEDSPHEFNIEFEIAKSTSGGRYRRPYVAVWIEDQDDFPVKTLSLFLMTDNPGPRWHRDLRRWYSSDQVRLLVDETKLIGTISKPTRNPGNYKVAWDGKDDAGKLLKDGKYTLYIEAAREHGTYQLMKFQFELGKANFKEELKGNVEIKTATVEYQKK